MIDKLVSVKKFKNFLQKEYPIQKGVKFDLLSNYIDLLEKPLKLEMFVPCFDGVPLEKPISKDDYYRDANGVNDCYFDDLKEFNLAEKKVLFEGFEYEDGCLIHKGIIEWVDNFEENDRIKNLIDFNQQIKLTDNFKQLIIK